MLRRSVFFSRHTALDDKKSFTDYENLLDEQLFDRVKTCIVPGLGKKFFIDELLKNKLLCFRETKLTKFNTNYLREPVV